MRRRTMLSNCLWLRYVVFVSSAWKNVGMTMTCNRCDVMNINRRKTKWHRNRRMTERNVGWGGGGGGVRERGEITNYITDVNCISLMLLHNVHYWWTLYIADANCTLLVYPVHYPCILYITDAFCTWPMHSVHNWCTLYITDAYSPWLMHSVHNWCIFSMTDALCT